MKLVCAIRTGNLLQLGGPSVRWRVSLLERCVFFALTLLLLSSPLFAADFDEYARLVGAVGSAHDALEGASPDELPALREAALAADLAVIEWLDTFIASDEFSQLTDEQAAAVFSDRYREEFNVSVLLIAMDRCEEARDRIRWLLDAGSGDQDLRPRLTQKYDEAVACLARARTATVSVTCQPQDAEFLVDEAFVGLASASYEVELGEHTATLRADGYHAEVLSFIAETEGQQITLGPITLIEAPPVVVDIGKPPRWYEWTLWGVGGVGIGTGIGFFINARRMESTLEDPPAGHIVSDPDGEREEIDLRDTVAYVAGGVGLASALLGTVLYFVRDGDTSGTDDVSWSADITHDRACLRLQLTF